jgi:hypothetical protein
MSPQDERSTGFEEQARAVLAESVTRIDSRIRSRLNQARQAAIAEVSRPSRRPRLLLMPAAGAVVAAVLVAMVLWQHRPDSALPGNDGGGQMVAAEDLDLIADTDGLDMLQDSDGTFYEWAAGQADAGAETST